MGKKGSPLFPSKTRKNHKVGVRFCQKLRKVQIQNLLAQDVPYVKETISLIPVMPFWKNLSQCFGCLLKGHISKKCRNRKTCKICSRQHPTSHHGDVKVQSNQNDNVNDRSRASGPANGLNSVQDTQSGVAFLGGTGGASKCSMIVPVLVSHCENPEREILVYALLDTQSDTSFILEDTCNDLGLSGIGVKLSLSTMYAENRVIDSQKVKGLIVRGFNNSLRISLLDTFTRNIMPANRTHIPTPDMAKMWPHLEAISDK